MHRYLQCRPTCLTVRCNGCEIHSPQATRLLTAISLSLETRLRKGGLEVKVHGPSQLQKMASRLPLLCRRLWRPSSLQAAARRTLSTKLPHEIGENSLVAYGRTAWLLFLINAHQHNACISLLQHLWRGEGLLLSSQLDCGPLRLKVWHYYVCIPKKAMSICLKLHVHV